MSQTMQAMVYHGANDIRFEQRPRPQILQPTDAIIRVTKSTICGTDLGIWKGKNPEIESTPGWARCRWWSRVRRAR